MNGVNSGPVEEVAAASAEGERGGGGAHIIHGRNRTANNDDRVVSL